MRLAVLRHHQEQQPALVRNGDLRQPRQAAAPRGADARGVTRALSRPRRVCRARARRLRAPVETDQARLCRMALPALMPRDATIEIVRQTSSPTGAGSASTSAARSRRGERDHVADCRFREPGRPLRSDEIAGNRARRAARSARPTSISSFASGWRRPKARAADPAPLGDLADVPRLPLRARLRLPAGAQRPAARRRSTRCSPPPIRWSMALSAASISPLAISRRPGATRRRSARCSRPAARRRPFCDRADARRGERGAVGRRDQPLGLCRRCSGATGQQALVATVGLALFLGEFLRLTQGIARPGSARCSTRRSASRARAISSSPPRPTRCSPALSRWSPRLALVGAMRSTRFGRRWRAYADDPLAAAIVRRQPARDLRPDFRAGRARSPASRAL